MRILISGIAGFVGTHLAAHCQSQGHAVWGFDRPEADFARLTLLKGTLRILKADLFDPGSLEAVLRESAPEAIVHLAAQSSVGASTEKPVATWQTNVIGALNFYEAIRQGPGPYPRVIFIGSSDVYGDVPPDRQPIREAERIAPTSLYAASKAAADEASLQYFRIFGIPIVRLRPANHTGPGQPLGFVAPDVACQIAKAEKGSGPREIRVGDLAPEKDFSDVRDMVRAYRLALEKGVPGEVYNVGSGRGVAMRVVVETLVSLAKVPLTVRFDVSRRRPGQPARHVVDASAFRRRTGWAPEIPLATTLQDVLEDWRTRI